MLDKITLFIKSNAVSITIVVLAFAGFGFIWWRHPTVINSLSIFNLDKGVAVPFSNTGSGSAHTKKVVFDFKINYITSDQINYYINYSYKIKDATDNTDTSSGGTVNDGSGGGVTKIEELLTVDKQSLIDSKQDIGTYVAEKFRTILPEINITNGEIKAQVDQEIASPSQNLIDQMPDYSKNGNPPPGNGNNPPAVDPNAPTDPTPPVTPPVEPYVPTGPAPIDYFPAPGDPPPHQ